MSKQNSFIKYCLASVLLIMTLVLGFASFSYLKGSSARSLIGPTVSVVYIKHELAQGELIEASDIELRTIAEDRAPMRAVPAQYQDLILNQMAAKDLAQGEALCWEAVYLEDTDNLSDALGLAQRAMSFQVDAANAMSGLITPGDRIDVMSVFRSDTMTSEPMLKGVLSNVYVLAVNGQVSPKNTEAQPLLSQDSATITVRVSPDQAALLGFAQTQGRMFVSLRNKNDIFNTQTPTITAASYSSELIEPVLLESSTAQKEQPLAFTEDPSEMTLQATTLTQRKSHQNAQPTVFDKLQSFNSKFSGLFLKAKEGKALTQ